MRQDEKGTMQRKAGNTGIFAGCLYSRSSRGHVCSAFYDYDLDGAGLSACRRKLLAILDFICRWKQNGTRLKIQKV